jgi:hypothetical protein
MAAPIEDWSNSELADALESNERFIEEVLDHIPEERLDEVPLWQWDRSDLIDYAYEYLNPEEDE